MNSMDLFRPMKDLTLSPRLSLSLRAQNKATGADSGEKCLSTGGTVTLLEALGALAAAGLVIKTALFFYRRHAVKKCRLRYERRLAAAKRKQKMK